MKKPMQLKVFAVAALAVVATACSGEIGVNTPAGSWGAYWSFNNSSSGSAAPGSGAASGGTSATTTTPSPTTKKSESGTNTTATTTVGTSNYTAEVPTSQKPSASGYYTGSFTNLRAGSY